MTDATFGLEDRDDTAVIAPVAAEPLAQFADMPAEDVTALGQAPAQKRRGRKALIITLSLLAVLVVAAVAGFFTARWYFSERVAPGVRFGAVSVTGQNRDELTSTVEQAVKDSAITVTDSDGQKVVASLADLGVDVDVDATVSDLLAAKSVGSIGDEFARINPFARVDVPLNASTDDYALAEYLTAQLVSEDERAVPASLTYDETAKTFAVTSGKDGRSPVVDGVGDAVDEAIAQPGEAANITVDYETVAMPVSDETAQTTAETANVRLANPIVINAASGKSLTIPAEEIAKWITAEPNLKTGELPLSYDENAIKSYLASAMPQSLNQDMVKEQNVTDKTNGKVLYTSVKGRDGVAVKNTDATASQVLAALDSGQAATIDAEADVTKFETESRVVDYTSANGDPHAVVDLTNQMAYFYKGSTLVKSLPFSSGKRSTATPTGTFFVMWKKAVDTMRGGSGADAYVTPNVPWCTYFTSSGVAFHGASWNPDGIASGEPRSHGCLNMYVSDAKWVYDFMPNGSMVQVSGSTPGGAVR